MSKSKEDMEKLLKFFNTTSLSPEEYMQQKLKKAELTVPEKMKIMHLNQGISRLSALKQLHLHTFVNIFKSKPDFYNPTHHYDWWAFPMHVPSIWGWQQWNYEASINLDDAKILLLDGEFFDAYLNCLGMYVDALIEHGWNEYPVRYARMLHSLALFLQAANKLSNLEAGESLNDLAAKAIEYANKSVVKSNRGYSLFMEGYKATKAQMAKFETLKQSDPSLSETRMDYNAF